MKRGTVIVVLVTGLAVAGCRQADAPLPAMDESVTNRLSDLTRNLQNISANHQEAVGDLADDLKVFVEENRTPQAPPAIDGLAQSVAQAISGKPFDEATMSALSRQLWLTVASRELSDKQTDTLQADVRAATIGVGASPESAGAVAAQAVAVQRTLNSRQRLWYEVF
jgi:hypothetical protein